MTIKKIPSTFRKYGEDFKLLKRVDNVALYSRKSKEGSEGFEVHKIRFKAAGQSKFTNPDGSIRIVDRPDRECLAGEKEFGLYGFYYQELPNAIDKFKEMIENGINR